MNAWSAIHTVTKRELAAYFDSPVAYVFIVIFLLLTGFFTFTFGAFFDRGEASLGAFFMWLPWLFLFLVPAVGMRLWSEERRSGTMELLLTFPITTWQAIVFSTHILEEVEAVCSRAIIIDRGAIVANGTPDELKARSDRAGAVLMTLRGPQADAVREAFARLPGVARIEILSEAGGKVAVRAYPDRTQLESAFAAHVAQEVMSRWSWTIEELHTEVGRLDDVFRAITRPDTLREAKEPEVAA